MKTSLDSRRWTAAALVATALLSLSPLPAPAQPAPSAKPSASASPAATATASVTATASASATATASAAATNAPAPAGPFPVDMDEQGIDRIDFEPYPVVTDKPVAPKPKEWATAKRVRFTRRGEQTGGCELRRLREWLRVKCGEIVAAVSQIAGNPEGVTVWINPSPKDNEYAPGSGEATFPMRPGDRRILQFFNGDMANGQGAPFVTSGPVVQAYWLEGAPAPVVIVR